MTPRDIIAGRVHLGNGASARDIADAILNDLTAAGYRILAKGELDGETLERAAKLIDDNMLCYAPGDREVLHPRTNPGNHVGEAYAAAIRALRKEAGGE